MRFPVVAAVLAPLSLAAFMVPGWFVLKSFGVSTGSWILDAGIGGALAPFWIAGGLGWLLMGTAGTGSWLVDGLITLLCVPVPFAVLYFVGRPILRLSEYFDERDGWRQALAEYRRHHHS